MGSRRDKKNQARAKAKAEKQARMRKAGSLSTYARKKAWLASGRTNPEGLWGWMVPSPKPWA